MKKHSVRSFPRGFALASAVAVLLPACGSEGLPDPDASGNDDEVETVSGDPFAADAWHLNNTGQSCYAGAGGTEGEDLDLLATHEAGIFGSGVKIAISDTGVEIAHEDLAARVLAGESKDYNLDYPYVGDPSPYYSTEESGWGHGTAVAGIIAATKDNGVGSHGVAPRAGIAGLRFLDSPMTTDIEVDQADGDFDIFNYSYGISTCMFAPISSAFRAQLVAGTRALRGGLGVLYVKAAGNEYYGYQSECLDGASGYYFGNSNLDEQNAMPESIVVAALNANGYSSSYSSPGANLWVSGFGGEFGDDDPAILTTDLEGCRYGFASETGAYNLFDGGDFGNDECNYTSTMNGTSSAAPTVAGAIALVLEANPSLSWRDVKYILAKTARKVDSEGGATPHPNGNDLEGHVYQEGWVTNAAGVQFHNWYGFGAVDVDAALEMAGTYDFPLGTYVETASTAGDWGTGWEDSSGSISVSIPDAVATGATDAITVDDSLVIESIQVLVNVTHSYPGDLGIELTSPAGTKSILMNINSGILDVDLVDAHFLSNAFLDENSAGTWTLKLVDGASQDAGTLTSWKIKINGHAL